MLLSLLKYDLAQYYYFTSSRTMSNSSSTTITAATTVEALRKKSNRELLEKKVAAECMQYSLSELNDARRTLEVLERGLLRATGEKRRLNGGVPSAARDTSIRVAITIENPTRVRLAAYLNACNPNMNAAAATMCQSCESSIPHIFSNDFPTELEKLSAAALFD
jgi:hypothetical protein